MAFKTVNLRPNPLEKANCLSKLFLFWTRDLFLTGHRKDVEFEDLFEVPEEDRAERLGAKMEKNMKRLQKGANIRNAIMFEYHKELLFLAIVSMLRFIVLQSSQPLLLGRLLKYFRPNSPMSFPDAVMSAALFLVCVFLHNVSATVVNMSCRRIGMKIRVAISNIVYRKMTRISQSSLRQTSVGNLVNFLSTDLARCDNIVKTLCVILDLPFIFIFVTTVLWMQYRWAGIVGLSGFIASIIFEASSIKLFSMLRRKWVLFGDKRIKILSEVIQGIHIVKTRVWDSRFGNIVEMFRVQELKYIRRSQYLTGVMLTLKMVNTQFAIFLVMTTVTLVCDDNELNSEKIFLIVTLLNTTTEVIAFVFSNSVVHLSEFLVTLDRLQVLLGLHEIDQNSERKNQKVDSTMDVMESCVLYVDSCTARWDPIENVIKSNIYKKNTVADHLLSNWLPPTLHDISFEVPIGSITAITGAAGSGKTSLLSLLIGELHVRLGEVKNIGRLSYAAQNPWIFPGTIRENILCYEPIDLIRYKKVLIACDLIDDFKQLPDGDQSYVDEKGSKLSGGQKSRIGLARAIYRQADIYIFDDPLNAIDSKVACHIYAHCLGTAGFLAATKSTRIIATHQMQFARLTDYVIVMRNGTIEKQGSPEIVFDLHSNSNSGRKYERAIFMNPINYDVDQCLDTKNQQELSTKRSVKNALAVAYFQIEPMFTRNVGLLIPLVLAQVLSSSSSLWMSFWLKYEENWRHETTIQNTTFIKLGQWFDIPVTTIHCIYIQVGILFLLFLTCVISFYVFFRATSSISQALHRIVYERVLSTKMKFFHDNPSGRILNRFTKDMAIVDDEMPRSMLFFAQLTLKAIGVILIATLICPIVLIPLTGLAILLYFIIRTYLRTALDLKRLEGIARSPIYTHLSTTLDGLPTIRAFERQTEFINDFNKLQDLHTSCWFLSIAIESAFSITLGVLSILLMASAFGYFLFYSKEVHGSNVGLTISQLVVTSHVIFAGNKEFASYLQQLVSLERLLDFCNLLSEDVHQPGIRKIPDNWPSGGAIEFYDVNYRYDANSKPVLRNISCVIGANEKIGIVGRTGAGKSSLIGSIYRLAFTDGKIIIDGVDIGLVSLKEIRSKILFIPKDPVLFTGTVRSNLDHFNEFTDDALWLALDTVELRSFVRSSGGLQAAVDCASNNWSSGQKQLLYMANAFLKKPKIIILDEATSYVDYQTENLICEIIKVKFAACTVITVAHRLHTIVECDRIMVLENGEISEFDSPFRLLDNPTGVFNRILRMLDADDVKRLTDIVYLKLKEE